MHEFATTCEEAAKAGGRILLSWRDRFVAKCKAPSDFVTEADLASQKAIREIVLGAFPTHEFLGEEDLGDADRGNRSTSAAAEVSDAYRWVVDPLDGTTNYVHGLQHYCVSVALERRGELLVGAVYDPIKDESFTAVAGQGAYVNGQALRTSQTESLRDALVAVSFSARVPRSSYEIKHFVEILHRSGATRRMGSAALNLCYIAAGRLDAYWATSVNTWDVAAGVLLVREAGGTVTGLDGGALDLDHPRLAASASPPLHGELLGALSDVEAG